jgi:hypothetical protein
VEIVGISLHLSVEDLPAVVPQRVAGPKGNGDLSQLLADGRVRKDRRERRRARKHRPHHSRIIHSPRYSRVERIDLDKVIRGGRDLLQTQKTRRQGSGWAGR